jgi:hypothetical protein
MPAQQGSQSYLFAELQKGKIGFINRRGKMMVENGVIPPQFREVDSFKGGLAPEVTGLKRWSYIDHTGKFVWTSQ